MRHGVATAGAADERRAGPARFFGILAAAVVFTLIVAAGVLFGAAVHSAAHPQVAVAHPQEAWPLTVQHGWWIMDLENGDWKPWDGPYTLEITCQDDISDYSLQYPHRPFKCVQG